MEDVKNLKKSRSDALRKFKTHKTKMQRICSGTIGTEVSLGDLLVELDEFWECFADEHGTLSDALQTLELTEAGAAVREGKVTGKTMEEYFSEAEEMYKQITDQTVQKISLMDEEARTAKKAKEEDEQKANKEKEEKQVKMKKFVTTRNVNGTMRSVKGELDRIGPDILNNPEDLRKCDSVKVDDVKTRLSTVKRYITDLEGSIEELVALELSECGDLLIASQALAEDSKLKADGVQSMLEVLNNSSINTSISLNPSSLQTTTTSAAAPQTSILSATATSFNPLVASTPLKRSTLTPGLVQASAQPTATVVNQSSSQHSVASTTSGGFASKPFKFKPMEFPTFSGRRRDWPSFNNVWRNVVEMQGYSKFFLAQQLWLSVEKGFAGDLVKAVTIRDDGSYQLMWDRLEEYYKDQGAVIASLYNDLDGLKSVKNDVARDVIKFANELELIHESLHSVSPEHPKKIDVNRVDRLVTCLPEHIQILWNRHYYDLDQAVKESPFTEFVIFMCRERSTRLRFLDVNTKPGIKNDKNTNSHHTDTRQTRSAECWLDSAHKGHWTRNCKLWKALKPEERRHVCLEKRKCLVCLEPYKIGHKCTIPKHVIEKISCKEKNCKVKHRIDVTCKAVESQVEDTLDVQSSSISSTTAYTARYAVQVQGVCDTVPLFADDASDISFVHASSAKSKGFKEVGKRTLNVKTINGCKKVQSKLYEIPVVTVDQIENIVCHSVPEPLTGEAPTVDIEMLRTLFPNYKKVEQLQRDTRPAEILLGLDYFRLHPQRKICSNGNLSVMRGPLGDTLVGCSDSTSCSTVTSYYISKEKDTAWQRFIQGEEIGTQVNPRCSGCKCGKCPQVGATYSFKEEQELRLIREGLSFNEEQQRWITRYPWIKPPTSLPDNRYIALATLRGTEKTLAKDPEWYKVYSDQIKDMEERGSCRKLTQAELDGWEGPTFYICHLAVRNPKSATTPVRIVFNSSHTCKGISLNSCLAKGPDSYMNCLLDILIRWREYRGVILGDISKMFHAIAITEPDQHVHRFLWRGLEGGVPDTYIMTALNMGDICSQTIAMEAVFNTGDRVKDSHPEVSYVLKNSSYVDDIAHSTLNNPLPVAREVHEVLKNHGFRIKQWWLSGEHQGRDENQLQVDESPTAAESGQVLFKGGDGQVKVLGLNWEPVEDTIRYCAELNFSLKNKGQRMKPDIVYEDFDLEKPMVLTRRTVLEQVGRIFDPLGLIGPHVLKAKLLLRKTWELNLKWDDVLPDMLYDEWIAWFRSCFELNNLEFSRCTRPDDAIEENPWLVIFSDGSKVASGYAAYVRWKVSPYVYKCYLVMAKSRIAPMKVISIPRLELNGAVMGSRCRKTLLNACRYEFEKVIHLIDSETVLCQVNSVATRFKVYEGTRVGEIQSTCSGDMSSWYWVSTEQNIADWNTRGKLPVELGLGSVWQEGPAFMTKPFEEWPVKSIDQIRKELPSEELPSVEASVCVVKSEESVKLVQFDRVSKWEVLVRAIAMVVVCCRARSFLGRKQDDISTQVLKETKIIIMKEVQIELHNIQQKYRKLGVVLTKEGIWVVGSRGASEGSYHDLPVIIPNKHPAAVMVMEKAHRDARHTGRDSTLAMCRQQYYMAQGSKVAKKVRDRCTLCRKLEQKTLTQKMGKVPLVNLRPAPVFNAIQIDLFGPWLVRGEVQKRITGKCWGTLFVCLASRAVHIEVIAGYSTEDFLMGLHRFAALRGWPQKICSDPGSQLVAADKELKTAWQKMNFTSIRKECTDHGADWEFSPADSPHYQGLTEALIKSVKRAVKVMYSHGMRLSWQEYVTVGHQAANMVNSRPLGVLGEVGDVISVLTPNALLLGRNTSDNPGCWPESKDMPRLCEVNELVDRFWRKWIEVCRPALVMEKKWNTDVRNLEVNDIVLVLDNDPLNKEYKLAKVCETITGTDGKVRSAKVVYKRFISGEIGTPKYSGSSCVVLSRCCQRLVLVVPVDELRTHKNDYGLLEK